MTSLRQLLRSSTCFLLFILLGMSLFWESCDNLGKQANDRPVAIPDTLPDVIYDAETIKDNFKNSSGDLGPDFIIDGSMDKATYFRLNENQTKKFYKILDSIKTNLPTSDPVRIRVQLGLFQKEGIAIGGRPNLSLLLYLFVNKADSAARTCYFPLRVLPNQAGPWISIPNGEADSLTNNWKITPKDVINKQLYENQDTSDPKKRIQYYTFNSSDTKDIYTYRINHPNCSFYLYLGIYNEEVPLRVIVRQTKDLMTTPSKSKTRSYGDGDDENYEFSVQCPNVCN